MPQRALTEAQAESIMQAPKRITDDVRWAESKEHTGFIKSEVQVEAGRGINLKVHLNINTSERDLFSFALILNSAQRIRGLDFNGSHCNKRTDKAEWKGQTHKHRWTDICGDGHAYTPNDITEDTVEEVFRQFCTECNIDFRGEFQRPPAIQANIEEML